MNRISARLRPTLSGCRRRRTTAAVLGVMLVWSIGLGFASPSLAVPGTLVNVEPETLEVATGSSVVLTAVVRHADGSPAVGSDSNTHVRWKFTPDSPNSPASSGGSADLQCWTGTTGTCSVSYVAASTGTDTVCAFVGGSAFMCEEPPSGIDWDNNTDAVTRLVSAGPVPTPDPTPTPTPEPTPDPTPQPTPDPTPEPTPEPTPDPTPEPTPDPTPDPTPTPTPEPTPTPIQGVVAPVMEPTPSPPPHSAHEAVIEPSSVEPVGPSSADSSESELSAPVDVRPAEDAPRQEMEPAAAVRRSALATSTDHVGGVVRPAAMVEPGAPTGLVAQVVALAVDGVTRAVRPEAAVAVAEEFTFPLALTFAVVAYLAVQGHIDRRDPKLRLAPQHVIETVVRFEPEAEL